MSTATLHPPAHQALLNAQQRVSAAGDVMHAYMIARDRRKDAYRATCTADNPHGETLAALALHAAELQLDAAHVTYAEARTERDALWPVRGAL